MFGKLNHSGNKFSKSLIVEELTSDKKAAMFSSDSELKFLLKVSYSKPFSPTEAYVFVHYNTLIKSCLIGSEVNGCSSMGTTLCSSLWQLAQSKLHFSSSSIKIFSLSLLFLK